MLKEITLNQKQEEIQNLLAKNTEPLAKINHRVQRKNTWKNTQNSLQKKKNAKKKIAITNTKHLATKKHNNHCQKKLAKKKHKNS